jgi:type II secretory pathway component PulF
VLSITKLYEVKLLPRFVKISNIFTLYLDAVSIRQILCNVLHCLKDLFLCHSIVSYIVIFLLIFLSIKHDSQFFVRCSSMQISRRYSLYISLLQYMRTLQGGNEKITFAQHSKFKSCMYKYFSFSDLSIICVIR